MAVSGNGCWKGCCVCHLLPWKAPCGNREKSARGCFKADVIPLLQQNDYHQLTWVQGEFGTAFLHISLQVSSCIKYSSVKEQHHVLRTYQ